MVVCVWFLIFMIFAVVHSHYSQNPIPRENFIKTVLNEIYIGDIPRPSLDDKMAHRLALLFMVFSLGCLMDIMGHPCSIEAEGYHALSRGCLCIQPVYQQSSLHAVQTMVCVMINFVML